MFKANIYFVFHKYIYIYYEIVHKVHNKKKMKKKDEEKIKTQNKNI